jgi:hypothetical protein
VQLIKLTSILQLLLMPEGAASVQIGTLAARPAAAAVVKRGPAGEKFMANTLRLQQLSPKMLLVRLR